MSYTSPEPRLFPRFRARHTNNVWWTETLSSPFLHPRVKRWLATSIDEPCFLHFRFCRRDPFVGYSADFREMVARNLTVGPDLTPEWMHLMRRWEIHQPHRAWQDA